MSPNKAFCLAVAAMALAGAAGAQDLGPVASVVFDRFDANHDGQVTKDEVQAQRARAFDKLDGNRDGVVSGGELDAAKQEAQSRRAKRLARLAERRAQMPTQAERIEALDKNNDSKVTREEFVAGGAPWFDRLNKNGAVSRADFAASINRKP